MSMRRIVMLSLSLAACGGSPQAGGADQDTSREAGFACRDVRSVERPGGGPELRDPCQLVARAMEAAREQMPADGSAVLDAAPGTRRATIVAFQFRDVTAGLKDSQTWAVEITASGAPYTVEVRFDEAGNVMWAGRGQHPPER
jgi:hypothetical protein